MICTPPEAPRRRSYAFLQETISSLCASFPENMRSLTRRACEMSDCPASLYIRMREDGKTRYLAAGHAVSKGLLGITMPQEHEGPAMDHWILEHTGFEHTLSFPVSLRSGGYAYLTMLADKPRRLTIKQYDALEVITLALTHAEELQDASRGNLTQDLFSSSQERAREQCGETLLTSVCRELVEQHGAESAWIALVDRTRVPDGRFFHTGLTTDETARLDTMLKEGKISRCASRSMNTADGQVISSPRLKCSACPMSEDFEGFGHLSIGICFNDQPYGWLTVSVPSRYISDHIQHAVLQDLITSLAISLHSRELDRQNLETQKSRERMLKHFERLSAFRIKQVEMMKNASVRKILQATIDEAEEWTESRIGFFHFIEAEHETISMQAWSTRTIESMCRMKDMYGHYQLDHAGIWADAIREKRTVTHNDYASAPNRKGLPEDHAELLRDMVVPIIRNGRVMAILGVGNKSRYYDEDDAFWVAALADQTWEIIENKLFVEHQELMRHQLEHAKKMEMIGNLASGLTHEINNPLNFIRLNIANLDEDFPNLTNLVTLYRQLLEGMESIDACSPITREIRSREEAIDIDGLMENLSAVIASTRHGVERITGITRSMRNFSFKNLTDTHINSNINKTIQDTLLIVNHESADTADIRTDLGKIPAVACNPSQIGQVVLNLLMNSLQAIRQQKRTVKGQIGIKTWADTTRIYCSITDDGPGIEQSVKQEIFTPFYTTKERGISTGLGLSISYDIIVHKHQGQLDFECPPEGGTVFTMALPLQQETASDQREGQS